MNRLHYREQALESIARNVIVDYSPDLYYGQPRAIPVEKMIDHIGLHLEFQYLRKNGRILGQTIFDDGIEAVYDMEARQYTLFPVKAGTILIDASLADCRDGRLRFTCAHELAHWLIHKKLYAGTGETAAFAGAQDENSMEIQANILGSAILMPKPVVKRCFYQMCPGRSQRKLIEDMAEVFGVSRQAMEIRLKGHRLI